MTAYVASHDIKDLADYKAKLNSIGFPWFVGGNTEEDAPAAEGVSSDARPEVVRGESKVMSENNEVASPGGITSG